MAFQQNQQKRKKSQYAASICSSWGTADPAMVARQLLSPSPILPSTQNALQRLLDNPHSLSESALEEFPSITYIV